MIGQIGDVGTACLPPVGHVSAQLEAAEGVFVVDPVNQSACRCRDWRRAKRIQDKDRPGRRENYKKLGLPLDKTVQ